MATFSLSTALYIVSQPTGRVTQFSLFHYGPAEKNIQEPRVKNDFNYVTSDGLDYKVLTEIWCDVY